MVTYLVFYKDPGCDRSVALFALKGPADGGVLRALTTLRLDGTDNTTHCRWNANFNNVLHQDMAGIPRP